MTGYCYVKVHRRGKDTIVAACDEELLGRVLDHCGVRIEVKESFYKGVRIPLDRLNEYLREATIVNLLGNGVVREAAKVNRVIMDAAVRVGGVLHVQLVTVRGEY